MPVKGARYRIKRYPSGKRVRLTFIGDKVVETKVLSPAKQSTSRKRLTRRKKRIGRGQA